MNSDFIRKLTTEFLDAVHNLDRTSVEFNLAKDRLTLALKGIYVEFGEAVTKEEIGKVAELLCRLTPVVVLRGVVTRGEVRGISELYSIAETHVGGRHVAIIWQGKRAAIITSDHADWN